jgi:hypothetical protein
MGGKVSFSVAVTHTLRGAVDRAIIYLFLNNQPVALVIQIYSVIKLYMFRASSYPSSGVFYCTFGTGKLHASFDDRFQAESGWNILTLLGSGH